MRSLRRLSLLWFLLAGGQAWGQSGLDDRDFEAEQAAADLGRVVFASRALTAEGYPLGPNFGAEYKADGGWPVWSLGLSRADGGTWSAHMVRAPAPPPEDFDGLTPEDDDFRPRWRASYLVQLYLEAIRARADASRPEILAQLPVERFQVSAGSCSETDRLVANLDQVSWDLEDGAQRAFGDEFLIITHADSLTAWQAYEHSTVQVQGMIFDGYITGWAQEFADAVEACATRQETE